MLTTLFGTSTPTVEILSGIGAIRTLTTPSESARSPARFVSLLRLHAGFEAQDRARDRRPAGDLGHRGADTEAVSVVSSPLAVEATPPPCRPDAIPSPALRSVTGGYWYSGICSVSSIVCAISSAAASTSSRRSFRALQTARALGRTQCRSRQSRPPAKDPPPEPFPR